MSRVSAVVMSDVVIMTHSESVLDEARRGDMVYLGVMPGNASHPGIVILIAYLHNGISIHHYRAATSCIAMNI